MSLFSRRFLTGSLSLVLILAIVLPAGGVLTARHSFPKVDGEIRLAGLEAPVDIYRDSFGIPQIYASSPHDLFFAQGYVHAQDRFWQMDFWRHTGSGRLSEMFGESQLDTDKYLHTLGWARVAQKELDNMDPEGLAIFQAYADGVNAYLADHQGSALSLEYAILKLLTPSYLPEPWQPLHTLTWAKAMAWDLRGNMEEEIERAHLLKTLTPEQVDEIFPPFPADYPVIVPQLESGELRMEQKGASEGLGSSPIANYTSLISNLDSRFSNLAARDRALDALLGSAGEGLGSNNWVISGKLTATGSPLLANDPHLGIQMPSIWYEIGLHCAPKGPDCPFDVTGFSFAGVPAVIIGHNDRIAWGMTNVGPDVMDLYIEKLNPANPNQYEVNGKWVDMELVKETIRTGGGDPVEVTVRYTRHGPVLSDASETLAKFSQEAGLEIPENYAIALRWTALEPSYLFRAIFGFNLARNWEDFRAAAHEFSVPSQNLIYADVDGNIGYQMPGSIPIRAGGDGRLPVPGWTDDYEWTGYIPFEQLPFAFNPPQGYIASANNAVVGSEYPYLITTDWEYGFRALRIVEMIENAPGPIDIPYIQQMQGDNKNMSVEFLLPVLMQISLDDDPLAQSRRLLEGWDSQNHMDSAPAVLFESFRKHLLALTFHDDLPEESWFDGGGRSATILRRLVGQPDSAWWDNKSTPEVETRDQIFHQAFSQAVAELEGRLGKDPARWAWGDLHIADFRNETLGESGIAPIEALFNRGGFRTSGGSSIVNATAWNASEDSYEVVDLPSMRMIVDFSDLSSSLAIHTTGQSGHAYQPHYADMVDLWRNIQYHAMLWERPTIEAGAEGHLRLLP